MGHSVVRALTFFEGGLWLIRRTGRVHLGAGRRQCSGGQERECQTVGFEARHVNPFQNGGSAREVKGSANLGIHQFRF